MSRRLLALTLDDGPHPDTTVPILDILAEYHVPASFFLIGQHITPETAPIIRRAVSQGCEIGNHSFSHPDLTACSGQEIAAEICETSQRIEQITGRPPRFFRPPYIAVNEAVFAQSPLPFICGYGVRDYDDSVSAEMRFAGVMRQAKDGGIILLHDAAGNFRTVEAVRRMVPALLEAGYTLVTVSELFTEKGITPQPHDKIIYSFAEQTTMYAPDTGTQIAAVPETDQTVLQMFSAHDDYMLDFLGDDRQCYTRYGEHEQLEQIWAAYSEGISTGCIAYRTKAAGVGEVKRLFVLPEYRGNGIAKKLLNTVECYAKERGCHTLFLDTRITLEPAFSFYRSAGFAVVFQQGLYVQMEKNLES